MARQIVETPKNPTSKGYLFPKQPLTVAINNVISWMIFGYRCSTDPEFEKISKNLTEIIASISDASNLIAMFFYQYAKFGYVCPGQGGETPPKKLNENKQISKLRTL